jgi:23S rRNA (adenine2503-C2)-methyltransferase
MTDLGRDTTVNLAISLNATDNKSRNMLMPINRKYPLEKLPDACAEYPLKPRRKITFEYILIKKSTIL